MLGQKLPKKWLFFNKHYMMFDRQIIFIGHASEINNDRLTISDACKQLEYLYSWFTLLWIWIISYIHEQIWKSIHTFKRFKNIKKTITYRLGRWNFGQTDITYIDFNIKLQCCKCLRAALHNSNLISVSELSKSNLIKKI